MDTMCFRVDSAYIVKLARDLVCEQGYLAGRHLLETAFGDDFPVQLSEDILSGKKTLQGINSAELADQDPEDPDYRQYVSTMRMTFAGTVFFDNKWWRPYAEMGACGPSDLPNSRTPRHNRLAAPQEAGMSGQKKWLFGAYRTLFYADNPQNDLLVQCDTGDGENTTFWEEVDQPPLWLHRTYRRLHTTSTSLPHRGVSMVHGSVELGRFQAALDEYCESGYRLEQRGWTATERMAARAIETAFTLDDVEPNPEEPGWPVGYGAPGITDDEDSPTVLADPLAADLLRAMVANGVDPEKAAGTIMHVLGTEPEDKVDEPGDVSSSRYGVITADGKYWPCMFHGHDALMRRLAERFGLQNDPEDSGWVKVHGVFEPGGHTVFGGKRPTDAAVATIQEYKRWWHKDTSPEPFAGFL